MYGFRRRVWRKLLNLVTALSTGWQPLRAFDTCWHSAATAAATRAYAFGGDAVNMVQFGNFSFWSVIRDREWRNAPEVGKKHANTIQEITEGLSFRTRQDKVRKMAILMHFDNLYRELNTNARFDHLFTQLVASIQKTLAQGYSDPSMREGFKKTFILMTLLSTRCSFLDPKTGAFKPVPPSAADNLYTIED